jgi:starch-binding outer membrane protein, SusD/RagB family
MKKLLSIIAVALIYFCISCDKEYLNVNSVSETDESFVFSSTGETQKVLMGMYSLWIPAYYRHFYDFEITGSDIECHPETFAGFEGRVVPECFYNIEPTTIDNANAVSSWAGYYQVANRANIVMEAIAEKEEYKSAVTAGTPNAWTQLYGEAAVFSAYSYFNLIKLFGDVPYLDKAVSTLSQALPVGLTSRFVIYDGEIANLIKVEPLMYRIGESGLTAERFSRTFAQALIGRICLFAGGWSTCRTDFDYSPVLFEQKGIEKWNAKYVRVTDYKTKYYGTAKTYLEYCVQNPGSARLITADPRGAGFNNPFQYHFQNLMDYRVSAESLYEVGATKAINGDYTYSFGRPSNGGGSNGFPCKSYGQSRIYASFYYGDFSPLDKRRDITVAVTSNSGVCSEAMIDFTPGNMKKGGLGNNKLDESRMTTPYTLAQRAAGVNVCQMRMADAILMLAEVYAVLGDDALAKTEFTKVRSRAFNSADQTTMVTDYINGKSGTALLEAIWEERKFEFAGEGLTRYDLIRTAKVGQKIKERRDAQIAMVNGLKSQGYYTFPNGNQISSFVYTKMVNVGSAPFNMTKMLTTECIVPESDPTWPVRFPGWRGNSDAWPAYTTTNGIIVAPYTVAGRNLAIKGLMKYIDPAGAEAAALVADGYKKTDWGSLIIKSPNDVEYTNIWRGYPDDYVSTEVPPRYFWPLTSTTIAQSYGKITNGYGFAQR